MSNSVKSMPKGVNARLNNRDRANSPTSNHHSGPSTRLVDGPQEGNGQFGGVGARISNKVRTLSNRARESLVNQVAPRRKSA